MRYQSWNRRPCNYCGVQRSYDIVHVSGVHQAQTQVTATFTRSHIIGQHAVWQTTQNGDYLEDGHLTDAAWKVPNRWPVDGQSVTGRRHAIQQMQMTLQHERQWLHQTPPCLFLYFAHSTSSLLKLTTAMVATVVRESFMGGRQCCSHAGVVRSTKVCGS